MGRSPCCEADNELKRGPWTPEEDEKLTHFIEEHGVGNWKALPKRAGLNRCGKSCRLRWANYLRPDIRRGKFSDEEERIIIKLHSVLGNKWSKFASHLPGRTDNEIKNHWNTHMRKKLLKMGIDPVTHKPRTDVNPLSNLFQLLGATPFGNMMNPYESILKLQADAAQAAQVQLINNLLQIVNTATFPFTSILNTQQNGLLGSANDHTLEQLLGSTNISPDVEINARAPQENLDSGLVCQGHNGLEPNTNSGACFEGYFSQDAYHTVDNSLSYSKANVMQNQLPQLVSSPSPDESSTLQMNETKTRTKNCSTDSSTLPGIDTLDKFLDDYSSESFWKEILDLTSLLSPVSNSKAILPNVNL